MGYDERQQPSSSGTLVAVIGVGLVLAILAIIAVAGVGLFWVRASTQQAQTVAMEERAIAELHRAGAEAHLADAMAQLEQSRVATTPDRNQYVAPRNEILQVVRQITTKDHTAALNRSFAMGYDERQQPNSSGTLVAVIGVGLVLAVLAIIAVAGVGLFWVRTARVETMVAQERVVAELHRAGAEAHLADAMAQLEQSQIDAPGSRLNFVLKLDREGNMNVAGDAIGLDDLKKRLAEFKDKSRNTFLLRIETDLECPARHITAVLEVCNEVGDIDYRIVASSEPDVSAGESKTDE